MPATLPPSTTLHPFPLSTVHEVALAIDPDDYPSIYFADSEAERRHGEVILHASACVENQWDWDWDSRKRRRRRAETVQVTPGLYSVAFPAPAARGGLRRRPQRTLSEPCVDVKTMAAVMEEEVAADIVIPSSPPDLSYSKSSDSSGASESSDEDGEKSTQVSIDGRDSIDDSNLKPESRPTLKRPPPRSLVTTDGTRKVTSPPLSAKENRYPNLTGQVNGVLRDQSLNLPSGRGLRRGFTAPSAPNLLTNGSPKTASRSPSPTKPWLQNGVNVSPSTVASTTPRSSGDARSPGLGQFTRRQSWQPGRKSVKELEAECNDEDEDVPDEAILENVPISPMPGQSRSSRSTTPSPQRRPSYTNLHAGPSHTNLHSANVPKQAKRPSAPRILSNGQIAPRSPRHGKMPMLKHSNTMPTFTGEPFGRKHRSKSWTEDLNEEAKKLSAALEAFADRVSMEKHGTCSGSNSVSNSVPSSPPRPSLAKQRAKTTVFDLPTVQQKGQIMIDPLPISKEKEAVLTKTRPSWLPPKDQKEEKRHMKEWEAMMARAAENEKKRLLREREAQETQDELKGSLARIWDQHVLPNWNAVIQEPRTRELWWRGVTPRSRGLVWAKAIGNDLDLTDASFAAALARAAVHEENLSSMSPDDKAKTKEHAWFDAIARDVQTPLPDLRPRSPFQSALADVLKAYAMYRPDVGYVYGVHLIAAHLVAHMPAPGAFVALANLLNRPLPLAFLLHDTQGMNRAYDTVMTTLKYKSPRLHAHLASTVSAEELLEPMFRTLFAYHLPAGLVHRVWDLVVFEGDKALIRTAVALLGRLETRLYGSREGVLDVVSWRHEGVVDVGSEEVFVAAVREAGKVDSRGSVEGV